MRGPCNATYGMAGILETTIHERGRREEKDEGKTGDRRAERWRWEEKMREIHGKEGPRDWGDRKR